MFAPSRIPSAPIGVECESAQYWKRSTSVGNETVSRVWSPCRNRMLAVAFACTWVRPRLAMPRLFTTSPKSRRSEEHTSELQSLMRNSYAVFCLKKKKITHNTIQINHIQNNHS